MFFAIGVWCIGYIWWNLAEMNFLAEGLVKPSTVPTIATLGILGCSVILLFRSPLDNGSQRYGRSWVYLLLVGTYALAIPIVGFWISTTGFLSASMAVHGVRSRDIALAVLAVLAMLLILILWVLPIDLPVPIVGG